MTENKKIFKNNFKNPSWNFKTDIIHQYAFWNDFLSKDECNKIIKQGKELNLEPGGVGNYNKKKEKIRESDLYRFN